MVSQITCRSCGARFTGLVRDIYTQDGRRVPIIACPSCGNWHIREAQVEVKAPDLRQGQTR